MMGNMDRRIIEPLLVASFLIAAPVANAQVQLDVTNMLRSLSGSLRGKETQTQKQEGVTPVIGVRGMDEVDSQQAAGVAGEDYVLMEGWAATKVEATAAAASRGLSAQPATMGNAKTTTPAGERQ